MEAKAVGWGIRIAKEAGLQSIILEIDSQEVADLINNRKDNSTEVFWIVSEIQALKKDFRSFEAKHVPRSCNTCAHAIVKLALERSKFVVWCGNFPSKILHIFNELNQ